MIRRIILKNLPNFLLNVNFHNSLFSVQKEYIDNSDLVNYIITSKKNKGFDYNDFKEIEYFFS